MQRIMPSAWRVTCRFSGGPLFGYAVTELLMGRYPHWLGHIFSTVAMKYHQLLKGRIMHKTRALIAAGTLLLLSFSGTSHADDPATKQPLDQAIESVDKNQARDPDNKGLQNAAERLQTNKERHEKKREAKEQKRHEKKLKKAEKKAKREEAEQREKAERPEKPARPEKPVRP